MNTNTTTNEFLLLFRGDDWTQDLSPEQMQNVLTNWTNWFENLSKAGKVKGGQPLRHEGKVVSGPKGRTVADGPFTESKETIGGYFLLTVDTIEEAVQIAQMCPGLDYGLKVEVRPVAERCGLHDKVEKLMAATA